jgi:hypothetical protein
MDDLEKLVKVSEELEKKLEADGQRALVAGFKSIFEAHPELVSFSWTQYTPYFNDGDACYFSVHEPDQFKFKNADGEEEDYEFYDRDNPERRKVAEEIRKKFRTVEQLGDHMKLICGDHAVVTLYADKIEVEEYEHD